MRHISKSRGYHEAHLKIMILLTVNISQSHNTTDIIPHFGKYYKHLVQTERVTFAHIILYVCLLLGS